MSSSARYRPARAALVPAALFLSLTASAAAEVVAADIFDGVRDAIVGTDPQASARRCVVADVSKASGRAFEATTPVLQPGVYEARLRIKLPVINDVNTAPLQFVFSVRGSADARRVFDMLLIERAAAYQDIPCRFTMERAGKAVVGLSWNRVSLTGKSTAEVRVKADQMPSVEDVKLPGMGGDETFDLLGLEAELEEEPPLAGLRYLYAAVDRVSIVPVGDIALETLEVEKIRYRPGERAKVRVAVRNFAPRRRELRVELVMVNDLDTEIPVDARALAIGGSSVAAFECEGPPFDAQWGYAARCRVFEGDALLAEREEYFTVHENMWAVLFAGRAPAQFTAHVTRDRAIASAASNKARYRNWVESGFWAPDEFGDFTPDTEKWWGGQGCYYGSTNGTRIQIEEGHKVGISFAVYANIWGGDGPPAFETIRRRPDWGYPSTFNVEWLDRWDLNPMGTGVDKHPMHVWPITIVNHAIEGPIRHHARELIDTHRVFGWDAVRYDSHAISDRNAELMRIVKQVVRAEEPEFQYGYNCSVPRHDPSLTNAFAEYCEGGGLIMEEGIRQFGGGGMSFSGGASYEVFARRILEFKEEARGFGGHFLAIGMDKCFPNDLLYQYIFWLAGNTHPCYDWQDVCVADYAQFATRFAGLIWDLNVTSLAEPEQWVDLGETAARLWLWKEYVHQRELADGRRQLIVHAINAPAEKVLYTHDDCKVPPPLDAFPVSVRLPEGARVRGVWYLTPEYALTQQRLDFKQDGGRIAFTVPGARFWSMAVVDLDDCPAFE